jgi:HEAT repeat protein
MNELLEMLSGGDLRSDGRANEVADKVVGQPILFDRLAAGLSESDDVIRARTAHALERVSRTHPEMVLGLLSRFMKMTLTDNVPMVRWHLAMIFGNVPLRAKAVTEVVSTLFRMLEDRSTFVRSWSVVSLTILGRRHRAKRKEIADRIRALQDDERASIRGKVVKALGVLEDEGEPMPTGWVKSSDASALLDQQERSSSQ